MLVHLLRSHALCSTFCLPRRSRHVKGLAFSAAQRSTPFHSPAPQIRDFKTPLTDGWGIASDADRGTLFATDSSEHLYELDPDSLELVNNVTVMDGQRPVKFVNEVK